MIFPQHIACTEERPDIVLFSNSIKTVIQIENTSGCEENAEFNHDFKTGKYSPLCETITENGWISHFFAIEVGARGYCSKSVPFCLKQLGFAANASRRICKSLGEIAMKCSFTIWLARDNKSWTPEPILWKTSAHSAEQPTISSKRQPEIHQFQTAKPQPAQPNQATRSPPKANKQNIPFSQQKPLALVNKGQTCYANTILQLFYFERNILTSLKQGNSSSQIIKALVLFDTLAQGKSKLDPKFFLSPLASHISKLTKRTFIPNKQHDVVEVLGYILDDLILNTPNTSSNFSFILCTSTICNGCAQYDQQCETENILRLQLSTSVAQSLVNYFVEEPLEGSNKINCPVCGGLQDAVKTVRFISTPNLLFVQLMRFVNVDGKMMKKSAKVRCNSKITIHVEGTGNEAATCAYSLSGIVSHIGNYEGGHYTFQGLHHTTKKVILCDDLVTSKKKLFEDQNAYLLVYQKQG